MVPREVKLYPASEQIQDFSRGRIAPHKDDWLQPIAKGDREVRFFLNQDWSKNREAFHRGNQADMDMLVLSARMRTRSKLGKPCCICGKTAQETQIVMHHVRHLRKLSQKREPVGFNQVLRMLNRKQIPVCEPCHQKIHQGQYDVSDYPPWRIFPSKAVLFFFQGEPGEPGAWKPCMPGSGRGGWKRTESSVPRWPPTSPQSSDPIREIPPNIGEEMG